LSRTLPPLTTPDIAALSPYEPGKPLEELQRELGSAWPPEGAIKLASNENPFGPSPLAVEAARAALEHGHRYPDGGAHDLREALAGKHRVSPGRVVCGAGSNELIDLIVQTFVGPGEEVLAPELSFACYRLSALGHRRAFRESPNRARFAYDADALVNTVSTRTKVVFLANPNNPTGAYLPRAALVEMVRRLPPEVVLVVDEAYTEYARAADYPDATALFGERERLIVLRTFSKIHGLAALRVGYAIAPEELIDLIHRVRLAFNVNAVGQAAARAALADAAHVERSRRLNAEQLVALEAALVRLGLDVLPSQANFLLVDLGGRDARAVYDGLLRRGVIVRPMRSYGLESHLRITVGTAAENQRLERALAELV
jgi:histidinol-phosphate aminotransferase